MNRKLILPIAVALVLGVFTPANAVPQDNSKPEKVDKTTCLACHGPYEDLRAATADYKAPSGEIVTPHQYVPHAEATDIPQCVECHTPHTIPPESKEQVAIPVKIDWCYASCHHANNLQPCSACH